jgi:hypothetical protein
MFELLKTYYSLENRPFEHASPRKTRNAQPKFLPFLNVCTGPMQKLLESLLYSLGMDSTTTETGFP